MHRLSIGFASAAVAISVLAASPTRADPFHLIRWADTGYCQIWDDGISSVPWPTNYTIVSRQIPTFDDAAEVKDQMIKRGACAS